MHADRFFLDECLRSTDLLHLCSRRILDGAIFLYPTETIYGIGGRADSDTVSRAIYNAKNRPAQKDLLVVCSHIDQCAVLGVHLSALALRCAEQFWPGPLTMVVSRNTDKPSIGVRVSSHPLIRMLCNETGVPLYSTSANLSDEPYAGDPDTLYNLFSTRVDFMIDGGMLAPSPPSTIIAFCDTDEIIILREGALPRTTLEQIAPISARSCP